MFCYFIISNCLFYTFQYQGTFIKDTTTWSDMQYEAEDTVSEPRYCYPKKMFLEKAEMVR